MKRLVNPRLLILDAAPGQALLTEVSKLAKFGFSITINCFDVSTAPAFIYPNVRYISFDISQPAVIHEVIQEESLGYDVIKSRLNVTIDASLMRAATSYNLKHPLKLIAQAGVGVSHIDCHTATEHGILVTNTPGSNANAVAEFVLAQMLVLARNIVQHDRLSHQGRWSKGLPGLTYLELRGKVLGLVGVGNTVRALIPKARVFGLRIIVLGSKNFEDSDAKLLDVERVDSLDDLLRLSDFLSIHVPLTEKTKNLMGTAEFQKMKPGSFLINTSRGGIVDEEALAYELRRVDRKIMAVAIDTFEHERASYHSPLVGLNNALLTPHIAGSTPEALEKAASMIADNIISIFSGSTDVPIVNREVLAARTPKLSLSS